VTCDLDVARSREALRADRIVGMATTQSTLVHEGVTYDFCVDTTHESAAQCAARIAAHGCRP
jgi:chloramphenicol 3-O phosphotransferase